MLALAAAVSYSRIYVGVHWPTDVAAGVLLGLASGWVGFRLAFVRRSRKFPDPGPAGRIRGGSAITIYPER
jgi:undecaprenyl-diphosphatase